MPSGLAALFDDIAAIAKLAAASIDDIGAGAAKAGVKAAGVVVDDAAVTPRYVTGFTPDRELPIIWRIAKGSLVNKILIILPVALLLSWLLPSALTPLLMLGGLYLCYEGAEKVLHALTHSAAEEQAEEAAELASPDHEKHMVSGAIRTDFILSTEIMVIALAEVADQPLGMRAAVLALVAVLITAGVYGAVGLIVKMDDIGLHMARRQRGSTRAIGRGLVHAMPVVMRLLSVVGIAAMIWVGGGIIVHGLEAFGVTEPGHLIHHYADAAGHAVSGLQGLVAWAVGALGAGLVGLVIGAILVGIHHLFTRKSEPA
jgi:hypothetical protein